MFKRVARIVGGALLVAVLASGVFLTYVVVDFPIRRPTLAVSAQIAPTPERLARGKAITSTLCAGCHYDQRTGGLTGRQMIDSPAEFGTLYSRNITQDPESGIGKYTDGELLFLLRTGIERDGTYPGPFMAHPHASDEDINSVIAFLRSDDPLVRPQKVQNHPSNYGLLFKLLAHVAWKPAVFPDAPVEAPRTADHAAYGRYLAIGLYDCYACHSADFKSLDTAVPERSGGFLGGGNPTLDADRHVVLTANLTADVETGLGSWTEDQFVRALREGFRPDNRPLRYPMEPMAAISPDEARAIWVYLKTVPVLRHPLQRWTDAPAPASASEGEKIYRKYACSSCHSAAGSGVCDLRTAFDKYKDAAGVTAFIRNPDHFVPGTKMPAWEGVIPDAELGPLVAYVADLGKRAQAPKR